MGENLPITCPLCGRKSEYPLEILAEGATIICPLCKVKLTLHGHMWKEIETEIKKVEELIVTNGGEIVEIQRWGNRRFAYEIKHKRQGYYIHFLYHGQTATPGMIEAAFKVNERIIRFLSVVSEVDLEARQQEAMAPPAEIAIPPLDRIINEPRRRDDDEN